MLLILKTNAIMVVKLMERRNFLLSVNPNPHYLLTFNVHGPSTPEIKSCHPDSEIPSDKRIE